MWWTSWHRLDFESSQTTNYESVCQPSLKGLSIQTEIILRARFNFDTVVKYSTPPTDLSRPPHHRSQFSSTLPHSPRFSRHLSAPSPLHLRNRLPPRPHTRPIFRLVLDQRRSQHRNKKKRIDFLQKASREASQ
jgi:hypothetical protein